MGKPTRSGNFTVSNKDTDGIYLVIYQIDINYTSAQRVELYIGDSPLTELTIPPSFKGANDALQRTTNLQRLKIADSTGSTEFGWDFSYIPTLESVEIGAGAPKFWGTFEGCENLKEVTVSKKTGHLRLAAICSRVVSLLNISSSRMSLPWKRRPSQVVVL